MRRRTLLAAAIISGCALEMGCSTGAASSTTGMSQGASELQAAAIKRMEVATGNAWSVSYDSFLGTAYHAAGSTAALLSSGVGATQATLSFLAENKEVFGMEDPAAELSATGEDLDEFGWRHANFQQHVGGVPIYGGAILAHYDTAGALRSVGAHYVGGARKIDVNPKITTKEALTIAVRDWKANFQATLDETKDFDREPKVELYVYDTEGKAALAWFVQVQVSPSETHDPAKIAYWVDARTGDIIHKYNGLETVAAKGSGTDVNGNLRPLDIDTTGTTSTMVDTTRPTGKVTTYDLKGATSGTTIFSATAADGPWDTSETAPHKGSGVGAHFYSEMVYDYYKIIHNRNSFDNAGMAMKNRVHYMKNWANASWDGTYMNYGDGDGKQLKNLTGGFDVIAHELTHGVTEKTSKFAYTNQVGGLNEGMSDIFGNLSEHWLEPSYSTDIMKNPNLAVGEAIGVTKPLRYMCAPKQGLSAQRESFTEFTAADDPHISSGIPNYAWCLMTVGGKHSNGTTVSSGIGWDKSAKVWYLTQTKYLASMANATFAQAAKANSDAATELGLTANEKNIIQCGWIAVKVTTMPATCGDTTGGDGPDGGTTRGDSGTPPPPTDAGVSDARPDTSVPPVDASSDRPTIDTNVPEAPPPTPDVVTPPPDAGAPDVTVTPDATGGRSGASGSGGSGGAGTGGTGGATGGTGGATGGTGGTTGGTSGTGGGTAGTGGTNRGGSGGSAGSGGSGPSDPGCGCTVPGQSAPSSKSTLALAVGFVAVALSRRRRRNAA
jgi:bacillolysin